MGQLATDIHDAAARIPTAPAATEADLLDGPELLAIFATVEAAVAALELRARGTSILRGAGPPDPGAGYDLDLYLDTQNGDLHGKDAGAWAFIISLRGPKGDVGLQGKQGIQGLPGLPGDAGVNGTNGTDGVDGQNGRDGNRLRVFAAGPAAGDGADGDLAIVTTTGELLEKAAGSWVVRGTLGGGAATSAAGTIDVTDWVAADLQAAFTEANWTNGVYGGPPISAGTGPYKRYARVPTATTPGWVYETHPVAGSSQPAIIRISLNN